MKIKLNYAGFNAMRRSPEVVSAVNQAATDLAQRANGLARIRGAEYTTAPAQPSEYGVVALVSARRAGAGKTTVSGKTVEDEARYATLEKAVGGAGA